MLTWWLPIMLSQSGARDPGGRLLCGKGGKVVVPSTKTEFHGKIFFSFVPNGMHMCINKIKRANN